MGEKATYLENGKFVSEARAKGQEGGTVEHELKILTANSME